MGFRGGSDGKEFACNAGALGLIPGLGRSPGEGKDDPLQNLAWRIPWTEESGRLQAMGLESDTTEQLTLSTLATLSLNSTLQFAQSLPT